MATVHRLRKRKSRSQKVDDTFYPRESHRRDLVWLRGYVWYQMGLRNENPTAFARRIGMAYSTLMGVLYGESSPQDRTVDKIKFGVGIKTRHYDKHGRRINETEWRRHAPERAVKLPRRKKAA